LWRFFDDIYQQHFRRTSFMVDERQNAIEAFKFWDMPTSQVAELAGVAVPRIADFRNGRSLPREQELKIKRAIEQIARVWNGYGIRIPPTPTKAFERALQNLEIVERAQSVENNFVVMEALRAELHRRELLAAAAPISSTPAA
jgi:hypothetical protein